MATLVLSSVGNALGGPVGGAIGALIGQSIDQQLLGPKTSGPRVGDLKVQSSSYGTQVPRIYGSMRVAGSVIWATDLVESTQASGAKGQPDTTYSYAVSLAVALSSRPVKRIGRIWADGKLLRGAGGDFKVTTTFRFYPGGEDQEPDPLIASAEGIAKTPAYRGLALAVFEGLELAEYGNRIPFMTFEVIADEERPAVGTILSDASGGLLASDDDRQVTGYAAYGQSIAAAVEPLIASYGVDLFDDGVGLRSPPVAEPVFIDGDEFGSSADAQVTPRIEREQSPARSLPSVLRLGYYEPALDYQSGEARATSGERLGVEERRDLPAAIEASEAKRLAQAAIGRAWARRDRLTLRLPPPYADLQPGAQVQLELSPELWRVEQCRLDAFVAVVELVPAEAVLSNLAADAGRIVSNKDVVSADVVLALLDVPDVLGQQPNTPTLLLAASAASEGWRSYNAQVAAGEQTTPALVARRKSTLGRALSVPASGDPYLVNRDGSFDVELIDADQWLVSCDDDALFGGRNLAVLGSEVLQFGDAEPLGGGRFRLTRLLRGRAGTEWAMDGHSPGEAFVLVEPDALRAVELGSWSIGAGASASVRNVSGSSSSSAAIVVGAESLRPLSPVALRAGLDADGNLAVSWIRRSRRGFAWVDGIDAPLGETLERYRLSITTVGGAIELETDAPAAVVGAAELAALGPGSAAIEVRQIGDASASRPAQISITI